MSTSTTKPAENTESKPSEDAKQPGLPRIDVNEYGGKKEGVRQSMNRRLFMQLLVFDVPVAAQAHRTIAELGKLLRSRKIPGVVYADTMSPRGIGLLSWGEDPERFIREVRPLFAESPLENVLLRSDMAMIGRSYSTGHEPELAFALLERPVKNVLSEAYPWHVWYPLRRSGAFARLEPIDQSHILREHAQIGMAYGAQELAHDIRLACHGLDAQDNEFVIGLVGPELHPLSHLVQAMRKTRQTSEFIAKMGPFFVGYATERSEG
ncbi:chlorite dismutase family protein [Pendulispora albinea]|uniref:Chlorite dismutase family protein n=1 Tax=Pendulispora albinea TaxID=2741071 RepID=A0ABZ2LUI3_9BACT